MGRDLIDVDNIKAVWLTVFYSHPTHELSNPFHATWTVRLRGDRADLVHLPGRFSSGPIQVVEESDQYYLHSNELEDVQVIGDARERVCRLVDSMNGALALLVPGYKPIEAYSLETKTADGSFAVCNRASEMVTFREPVLDAGLLLDDTAPRLVSLSDEDPAVADVLRLLGKGRPDAVTLYKLYEIISDDVGGDSVITKVHQWVSRTELARFTNSLNNRKVLGDDARHATQKFSPPRNPMSLDDALTFVRKLIINWLHTKVASGIRDGSTTQI